MNNIEKVTYRPIGIIHTGFVDRRKTPVQSVFAAGTSGIVELYPEYCEGLKDLREFSHIILIYQFHQAGKYSLISNTHIQDEEHSVFAMKITDRPNPIGISIVKLDAIKDNILEISEIDILDGTPLIDIKPFVPVFDNRVEAISGWFTDGHAEKVRDVSKRNSLNPVKLQTRSKYSTTRGKDISFDIIGTIYTPFTSKEMTPIQGVFAEGSWGRVEVYPEYADGLRDVGGFSHLVLLYHFHLADEYSLICMPFLEEKFHGIFSTRHFNRPNPIGLSIIKLESVEGNILNIGDVDILDGTPLLDIKPFAPVYDNRENATNGWLNSPYVDMVK